MGSSGSALAMGVGGDAQPRADALDLSVESRHQALRLEGFGPQFEDQRPHLSLARLSEPQNIVDRLGSPGRIMVEPLACHLRSNLDPIERL